jgi:L-lactate dehydrogenase complex protein LldG
MRTLAYLAQHLIVLLDPADIVVNIRHAYARPEFRSAHYACFHTGPSATADIEGVLIHGAQGVRSLSILPVPRGATSAPNQSEIRKVIRNHVARLQIASTLSLATTGALVKPV